MSLLRDDDHGSTATAVAVACVALAVLVPAVTAATSAHVSGEAAATVPETDAPDDRASVSCGQGPASIGATSAVRERPQTARSQSTAASAGEETVPLGGIAFVTLSVADGLNSTVEIGAGTNHSVEGIILDDGDGRATLRINTYAAANGTAVGAEAYSATGEDELVLRTEETDVPMTNRTYSIGIYRGDAVVDVTRLNVTAPDFGTVTALSGPPQLIDAGTHDAVQTADGLGMLSGTQTEHNHTVVQLGETLVYRIESPTLLGAVAAQPGESPLERFRSLYRNGTVTFDISGRCNLLEFGESVERGAVRAVIDRANGTAYLLVDEDRGKLVSHISFGRALDIEVDEPNPLGLESDYIRFDRAAYGDPSNRPMVERLGPYSYYQRVDGIVSWPTDGSVEISGESEQSSLTVGYRSLTDPSYRVSRRAEVRDETFARELPLPDVEQGLFEVTVGNTSYTAKIGDPPNATWELAPPDAVDRVDRIGIEQLKLEDGGFVVAYRPNDNASSFRNVGSAGANDIAMPVAPLNESAHLAVVAHRDGNDNGRFDGPETDPVYRVGGNAVREWVTVEIATDSLSEDPPLGSFAVSKVGEPVEDAPAQTTADPSTPATPTPTATPSDTPSATPTPVKTPTPEPTATESPAPTLTDSDTATAVSHSPTTPDENTPGTPTATTTEGTDTAADGSGFGLVAALVALAVAWCFGAYRRV